MLTYNPYARKKRSRPTEPNSQQPPSEPALCTNDASQLRSATLFSGCGDLTPLSPSQNPSIPRKRLVSSSNSIDQRATGYRPPLASRLETTTSRNAAVSTSQPYQKAGNACIGVPYKNQPAVHFQSSISSISRDCNQNTSAGKSDEGLVIKSSSLTSSKSSPSTNRCVDSNSREHMNGVPPRSSNPPCQGASSGMTRHGIDRKLSQLSASLKPEATAVVPPHSNNTSQRSNSLPQTKKAGLIDRAGSLAPAPQNQTTVPSSMTANSLVSIRPTSWGQQAGNQSEQQKPPLPLTQQSVELPGEAMLPKELSFSPDDVKPIDDGNRKSLVRHANLQKLLLNGWTLFPHQKKSILQGVVKRRMILALDMGLGKTLIGCVWAKSFKSTFENLKVFVVCPVSLKTEWKRTAENATGLSVETEKGSTDKDSLDLRICSWAKVPTKVAPAVERFVVLFDEAHSMQSMNAARTKDAMKLVLDERCAGVLLLTGTPMKNGKPSNLFPLLKAVRHPLGNDQMAYEKHFCAGMLKNFGRGKPVWDASGCSNLKQLKRLVASNLLHLTKDQCLTLPPLERQRYQVPISHRNQLQYIQAVKNLASLQAASHEKKDLGEAVLGAVQKLRSQCSFAKIGATVELVKKILEQEPSVVIFTSFATVAKSIHNQLSTSGWDGELLTGETPQKKRQGMVDNFQAGHSAVFVCTFGAGGVGLTLTASCSIILLDRPWTPGDTRQAEDRIRRIGQTKKAKSFWMSGFELDKQIDDMILTKEEASNAVLADSAVSTVPASKINIPKLLHCLIAKVS